MDMRIYRTWKWEPAKTDHFGISPLVLVSHDELQYQTPDGDWQAVPLVEGPKPEHPDVIKNRQSMAQMDQMLRNSDIAEQIQQMLPNAAQGES